MPFEPTLQDYLNSIRRRRRLVLAFVLAGALVASVVTLFMPRAYRAESVIFVRTQTFTSVSIARQIELPLQLQELRSGAVEYVVAVLKSRVLAEAVVKDVHFPAPAQSRRASAAQTIQGVDERVGLVQEMTSVQDRRGLITLSVDAPDPRLAMNIANSYIRLLDRYVQSQSSDRRKFLETQLDDARVALRNAEEAFRRFQDEEGILALDIELEESVKAIVALEAEIAKTETTLAENAQMAGETGSLTQIAMLQTQRAGLIGRQAELKRTVARMKRRMEAVPDQALRALRLRREVELQTARYRLLQEQYLMARINEQQEESIFQTIDQAVLPTAPIRPRPLFNLALGLGFGLFLGLGAPLVLETYRRMEGRL